MTTIELDITDVAHGGVCVGRFDGRVVFVRGALPGERVRATVTKQRSKLWNAVVVDVIEASPHRVNHPWPDGGAGQTGAADLGHATLEYQRELKSEVLANVVRRIGGEELEAHVRAGAGIPLVEGIGDGDGWGTRTRIDLVKMDSGFGMFREQSHDLVSLDSMPLAVPDLAHFVFGQDWDDSFAPGTRVRAVSPSSGENVLFTDHGAFVAPGDVGDDAVWESVSDRDHLYDYRVNGGGFWQIHYKAPAELLIRVLAGAKLSAGMSVLELFAGAGLFSVPLARAVGETGSFESVEGTKAAVHDARQNLVDYPWAHARAGQIDGGLSDVSADVVVADPPRSGLGVALAQTLGKSEAERIVLVSCDPASMARDVSKMVESGRQVISMKALDIFPHTHHFEVVTVLQ